jgi:hypothetical protein
MRNTFFMDCANLNEGAKLEKMVFWLAHFVNFGH